MSSYELCDIVSPFFLTEILFSVLILPCLLKAMDPIITQVIENSVNFSKDQFISEEKIAQQAGCIRFKKTPCKFDRFSKICQMCDYSHMHQIRLTV